MSAPENHPPARGAGAAPEHVFYDGDCGICHWFVSFVARRDGSGTAFRFAPLGGETFTAGLTPERREALPDSVAVLTADGSLLLRSRAAVHILRRLGGVWRALGALLGLVPRSAADFGYDCFAAVRRRLTRQPEGACPRLPPELARRFDP